ncbi:Flagellar motor rotation protein MotB [hydrothermal vent metagenome]|uniref:Flagellar motor rotation protein MotB n=1 Tax=hydrothermal vent metagenome TaxID=652676 RepID=A0A3B1AXR6_9ZZZZ
MRRKRRQEDPVNHERWLVSYADFITLLFAFFVVMYSVSSVNEGKYRVLSSTLAGAFQNNTQSTNLIQIGEDARTLNLPVADLFDDSLFESLDITTLLPDGLPAEQETVPDQADNLPENSELSLTPIADDIKASMKSFVDAGLVEVTQNKYWIEVEIKSKMLFASGTARVSYKALKALRKVVDVLKPLQNVINVEGHTDDIPIRTEIFPSNWELSAARAASVVHIFYRLGISPKRLAAIGYAEHRPVADNSNEQGRQKNRRVSLLIMASNKQREGLNLLAAPAKDAR